MSPDFKRLVLHTAHKHNIAITLNKHSFTNYGPNPAFLMQLQFGIVSAQGIQG